ncbi:MAG: hypothetical protein IJ455_03775 [Agathobacter sp.]|nr:hypothetical protein [Agathobacter sp.]
MKKVLTGILLVVALCLTACGNGGDDTGSGSNKGLVLKDFIENIEVKGTKWTEYTTKDAAKDFGIPSGSIKNDTVFYTDKSGKEHSAYVQWDDFTDSGRILQMYYGPGDEYEALFDLHKMEDGKYIISSLSAEKRLYQGSSKEPLAEDVHEAYMKCQGGLAPYLDENNLSSIKDILVFWGIDKLDTKAFEIAIDMESTELQEYEFVCESDYGEATIEVSNEYQTDGIRRIEVDIVMRGEEDTYYIGIYENYDPTIKEDGSSFFYVLLGKSIRLSE